MFHGMCRSPLTPAGVGRDVQGGSESTTRCSSRTRCRAPSLAQDASAGWHGTAGTAIGLAAPWSSGQCRHLRRWRAWACGGEVSRHTHQHVTGSRRPWRLTGSPHFASCNHVTRATTNHQRLRARHPLAAARQPSPAALGGAGPSGRVEPSREGGRGEAVTSNVSFRYDTGGPSASRVPGGLATYGRRMRDRWQSDGANATHWSTRACALGVGSCSLRTRQHDATATGPGRKRGARRRRRRNAGGREKGKGKREKRKKKKKGQKEGKIAGSVLRAAGCPARRHSTTRCLWPGLVVGVASPPAQRRPGAVGPPRATCPPGTQPKGRRGRAQQCSFQQGREAALASLGQSFSLCPSGLDGPASLAL